MKRIETIYNDMYISKDWLYNKYVNGEMSIRQISIRFNYSYSYVYKKFYEFGLKKMSALDRTRFRGNKTCNICKKTKTLVNFCACSERRDGYNKNCRVCAHEIIKKYRKRYKILNKIGPSVSEKICGVCKKLKPIRKFSNCASNKSGLNWSCRICDGKKSREYYKKTIKENNGRVPNRTSTCCACGLTKGAKEFPISRISKSLLYSYCKRCTNSKSREYYKKDVKCKERSLNRGRRWRDKNRLASIKKNKRRRDKEKELNDYDMVCLEITKTIFQNRCFRCLSTEKLHVDHHYCLNDGYGLTIDNAVILCHTCNCSKHTKSPEKFYTGDELKKVNNILRKARKLLDKINKSGEDNE